MAEYEVSAAYIDSLVRVVRLTGRLPEVEKANPRVSQLVSQAWSNTWQPALTLEAFTESVAAVLGEPFIEEMAYQAMKQRFGGIVLPLLKRSVAAGPAMLFARLDSVVKVAIQGAALSFVPEGESAGLFTVAYPRPVPALTSGSWRGVIRYVFEVTGKATGRIDAQAHTSKGKVFEYRVAW